jgi:hypothetical protein
MSLYKQFKTNTSLEVGGKWFEVNPPNDDGTKAGFLMARRSSKNTKFAAAMERVVRTHRDELDRGAMPPEESRRILVETFVDTVLKDWRHVRGEDERELKFTRDNALKLFNDLPDLFDTLQVQSGLITNYQDKLIEAAGGK